MKKSLIALAVLATTGAAFAQSSVALYGRLDVGVANVKDEISWVAGSTVAATSDSTSRTVLNSNILNNSLWGLRGSEDLGNGLKATFNIESGLSVDTGAQADANSLFNRKATVGLTGGFGTVELGRNYTAYDTLRAATNNTADTNVSITNDVWQAGRTYTYVDPTDKTKTIAGKSTDYTNRVNNAIRFDSAVYGGVSGSVAYAFGENKATGKDATDNLSLHVKYANGPLLVGYAHQLEKAATGKDTKYNLIAGSYDFGVAKLVAGYNTGKRVDSEDTEYQFGVQAPMGAVTLFAGYANSKNETLAGATIEKRSGFDLAATYALSKRTTAYAGYKNIEVDASSTAGVKGREINVFGAGLRHVF